MLILLFPSASSYLIPLTVGLLSYTVRIVMDYTCSPYAQVCSSGSELLSHIYAVIFCFLFIVLATKGKQIKDAAVKVQAMLQASNGGAAARPGSAKSKKD
jgi:hypothetical protein